MSVGSFDLKTEVFEVGDSSGVMTVVNQVDIDVEGINISNDVVTADAGNKKYVKWGDDNQYPYHLIKAIRSDEVLSPNKELTVKTCYGAGLFMKDLVTGVKSTDKDVNLFMMRNNMPYFMLSLITDFKYFFMSVDVIILNKERTKIVQVRHKEMCNVRLAERKKGVIPYVFSGDFSKGDPKEVETIELLDIYDPLGDLNQRLGLETNDKGVKQVSTTAYKFAVLTMFPTPGDSYYPTPYYTSFVRSRWYDIKRLIPIAKKAKLKNIASLRYLVEVGENYFTRIIEQEKIHDPEKQKERVDKEKRMIIDFVSGLENSGKTLFSVMYTDQTGKPVSDVKITVINAGKEGGDWSEDIAEASSVACYADGIHPNMVGATPGKSGMNNSGSDKRELFTMKQSMETTFHHLMMNLFNVIIAFNGWNVEPVMPMITLTTLDKHKDAEMKDVSELTDTRNE